MNAPTDDYEARIARLKTPQDCRAYAENAKRLGREDLVPACLLREAELLADLGKVIAATDFEKRILRDICLLERLSGKPLSRTRPMIARHGFVRMVERIVTKPGESSGFKLAVQHGLAHATFEQAVCDNPELFSEEALAASQTRLELLRASTAGT